MSIINRILGRRNKTAVTARDRLQILIAQERVRDQMPDYLPTLQREIMDVLSKYFDVEPGNVLISHDKQDGMDVLELNITLPEHKTEG